MPRLLGVDIPDKKRVAYALAYLFGVGHSRASATVHNRYRGHSEVDWK